MDNKVYYPIFLDLSGKRCVVVGGGRVAERKCSTLIKTGARITVISPNITKRLAGYREKGLIRHIPRGYRSGDIKTDFIVPSVLRRGLLTIAISTGGASPAMAKAIRKELQKLYGRKYSRYLDRLR